MLPASTCSPPNFFTPRRWPAESRPLREEPPDFLWAIGRSPYFGLAGLAAGFAAALGLAAAFAGAFGFASALALGSALGLASAFGAALAAGLAAALATGFASTL